MVKVMVPVLIQMVAAALLTSPLTTFPNRPNRADYMKMWIRDTAVLLVRLVDGEVYNHTSADKLIGNELPCKSDVLVKRKFVLQGNVKAVCRLGFLAALGFLHGVPKGGAVCGGTRRGPGAA